MPRSLIVVFFTHYALANVINYRFHDDNENELNECIERSMEALMEETCLYFRQTSDDQGAFVTFVGSAHCSWQESNRTVHLNSKCITDDFCYEIIGRVLAIDKPRSHIARHLNLHYNCTEKCTIECHHGGRVQEDCSCRCSYGFAGKRCEQLAKQVSFTDKSCGIINVDGDGVLSLSTYPQPRDRITFCQWLLQSSDPWAVIEVDIEQLGLDGKDIRPGSVCNDLFIAFGEQELLGPISCDGSKNVTHLRSKSNWLLLELRSDPYSEASVTGPLLRYSVSRMQPAIRIYSEGMTSSLAFLQPASLLAVLLLGIRLL